MSGKAEVFNQATYHSQNGVGVKGTLAAKAQCDEISKNFCRGASLHSYTPLLLHRKIGLLHDVPVSGLFQMRRHILAESSDTFLNLLFIYFFLYTLEKLYGLKALVCIAD